MNKFFVSILSLALLLGCAASKQHLIHKNLDPKFEPSLYGDHFTGFILYDPITKDTLYNYNSKKYFTPASNTKIFTLYTALKLLGNYVPTLKYSNQNDTLYIEGTGDPSLLHSYFKDSTAVNFVKSAKNIALCLHNFKENKYGPGWAWEDYDTYYSPERSGMPLYGNVVTIFHQDSLKVTPSYFKKSVVPITYTKNRDLVQNTFYFDPSRKDTVEIPFKIDSSLTKNLWEAILHKKITLAHNMPVGDKKTLFSIASDSLYKRMMYVSDNFIAEQLLIVASSTLSDTLNGSKAKDYIMKNNLSDLEQPPRWVDGSGLSRYNLFTPESMVQVLGKLYAEVPKERLFNLFPVGGVSGTLKNWYKGNPTPYIYAKSGSLSNNYCLSGYLITHSGKTLIFSFMNNHFKRPTSEIKHKMETIFEWIRDHY